MVEVAKQNIQKAHYAYNQILKLAAFSEVYKGAFFNEFIVKSDVDYAVVKDALLNNGMIAGLHLGEYDETLKNHILFFLLTDYKQLLDDYDHAYLVLDYNPFFQVQLCQVSYNSLLHCFYYLCTILI